MTMNYVIWVAAAARFGIDYKNALKAEPYAVGSGVRRSHAVIAGTGCRQAPTVSCQSLLPAARSRVAILIFFILRRASIARFAFPGSGSPAKLSATVGIICQDTPYLSLSQPHCDSSPPSHSLSQNQSTSSWVLQSTRNDIASVNFT